MFSYGRCRLARAASRLTVPPTPSHGPLPRDVAERFHSAGESTFLAKRFESTRTIAGTHRLHSFRPISADKLEVRDFSANEDKRIECVFANSNTTCDNVNITANTGYITAVYDRAWRLAYVTKAIPDSGEVEVSFLELRGPSRSFKYPTIVDILVIGSEDVLTVVNPTTATGRSYTLSQAESAPAGAVLTCKTAQ